jgi:hypothetical protein
MIEDSVRTEATARKPKADVPPKVQAAKREMRRIREAHPFRYALYSPMFTSMWKRSLRIEPDGAGLDWIVQSARELMRDLSRE